MSGIKENQEIRQVRQVNAPTVKRVSIRIAESQMIPGVVETAASAALILMAPQLIKAAFNSIEKATNTMSVADGQKIASTTAIKAVSAVSFSNVETAQHVATLVGQLKSAQSLPEIQQTCTQIKTICIQEQMPVFKEAITTTVKTVMAEVGFTNINVKTINSTPIITAKNAKGQTIRTEVTEDKDQRIDLVRIQSAIPESECDSLNEKINLAFKKHGLDYSRFSKTSSANNARRTFNFSDNEVIAKNNQTNHLKQ